MPRQSSLDWIVQLVDRRLMTDYALAAENLITGSLADDDVAMGGYHIGRGSPKEWRLRFW